MSVTPAVIATALGVAVPSSGSTTEAQWVMWITDATRMVQRRAERVAVDYETIDPDDLDYVIREAVVDHVKHPDDATQVSVSIDDGNVARSYRSSTGRVRILDEWWDLLGLGESGGGGVYAVDTVGSSSAHLPWCSLMLGANYCSCGVDIAGFPLFESGV